MPERFIGWPELHRDLSLVGKPLQALLEREGVSPHYGTIAVDAHNYSIRLRPNSELPRSRSNPYAFSGVILRSTEFTYAQPAGEPPVASVLDVRAATPEQTTAMLKEWESACREVGIVRFAAANVPANQREIFLGLGYQEQPARGATISGSAFFK